jgi:hypothetical protein
MALLLCSLISYNEFLYTSLVQCFLILNFLQPFPLQTNSLFGGSLFFFEFINDNNNNNNNIIIFSLYHVKKKKKTHYSIGFFLGQDPTLFDGSCLSQEPTLMGPEGWPIAALKALGFATDRTHTDLKDSPPLL